MNNCFLSRQASQDLDAISDYFLARNIEAGERICLEFTQKCEKLMRFPKLGRSYDAIRSGMRGLPLEGYIIFYQVVDDGVEILRVLGGRQNLEEIFSD
ncbi:Toxin ParE1 [Acaryochloris thomasi RCC1774]|uniref:Toxin ParE1 n=1 Tax=Acaryochloris thomasi RCC1774 TaxID=1764569 RepID=A0A2W1JM62_9CYAN|nr:type II toxin-antitoxin system RelE/ParE family toxin [Acaryochloris thomasi]PZD74408.1 Toxin ParE1 [Acaryochloris thomasi RCC1774]